MTLNINEVAARLKLSVETVHRWVRQGKIPMQRSHDTYTIRTEILERWAEEHKIEIQDHSESPDAVSEVPAFDTILSAMQRGGVFFDVQGDDRQSVLSSAVKLIPNIGPDESGRIFEKLMERETLASTGIGHGIALPHPRTNPDLSLEMPQITTCFLSHPVQYDAIDGQPVTLLMILLSHSTKQHLAMLSKVSYYLRDRSFRDYLLTKPSKEDIFNNINKLESEDS